MMERYKAKIGKCVLDEVAGRPLFLIRGGKSKRGEQRSHAMNWDK